MLIKKLAIFGFMSKFSENLKSSQFEHLRYERKLIHFILISEYFLENVEISKFEMSKHF